MANAQPKHTFKIATAVVIAYNVKKREREREEEKVPSLVDEEAVADHRQTQPFGSSFPSIPRFNQGPNPGSTEPSDPFKPRSPPRRAIVPDTSLSLVS